MQMPKVATVWLEGCSGCHMSFLDLDEDLVGILSKVELTHTPITDFKHFDFPEVTLGIVEGAVGNSEQLHIVKTLRQRSKILMAWGDCAVFGGINTMRNAIRTEKLLQRGYVTTESTIDGLIPDDSELPVLLDRIQSIDRIVPVDVFVPGCPPSPEVIAFCLTNILEGKTPVLPADMLHFD